jgi:hypothetical protein
MYCTGCKLVYFTAKDIDSRINRRDYMYGTLRKAMKVRVRTRFTTDCER